MSDRVEGSTPWQRLSVRVVWVDIVVSLCSLLPGGVALWVTGAEPSLDVLWPLALIALLGVTGGIADIMRWACTTYRVTDTDVELRTGLFVRRHRTLHRDRVRSVDTAAKLRHRLAGLRVVTVGAGQQTGTGEAALLLDALSTADAAALRARLLARTSRAAPDDPGPAADVDVLATFRPWWVIYNMFSIWAYIMAAGLLWGGFWLVSSFGIDLVGLVMRAADWASLGWLGIAVAALIGGGVIGAVGLGVSFLLGYWRFELARVRSDGGSYLRTRRGLFSTREVNRDESRMRGMSIGEPLLWRWMGMADTNVITTGLGIWDAEQPTAILPRGPVRVARRVAREVFGAADPFSAPLTAHPRAALRRRLWWATVVSAVAPLALVVPAVEGTVPAWTPWAALGLWPVALLAALVAYRSLGHAIAGEFVVVRSGLLSRTTSALRRDAVSTIAVRQSVLQRRLRLATVSAMTAAGWSAYEAPDVPAEGAVGFAAAVAPGVLDEFLERPDQEGAGMMGR